MQRFVTLIERTLEHVIAGGLETARFSLTPSTVVRVLVGVPAEHLRTTVSAVGRIQAYLSEEVRALDEAIAELKALVDLWTERWES